MIEKRKLGALHIIIYLIVFFAIWSVRELYIRPVFLDSLDGFVFQIAESSMKLLVWTLPAILLIRHYHADMWISLKEMFTNKPKWSKENLWITDRFWKKENLLTVQSTEKSPQWSKEDLFLLIGVMLLFPLRSLLFTGTFAIRPDFMPITLIESVVFAGITEEVVFRGFLLNTTLKKMSLGSALLLNAVLFTLIHFPIWIYAGHDLLTFVTSSIAVMALSILFSISFLKTKNIFVPIALHMGWNLLVTLFGG